MTTNYGMPAARVVAAMDKIRETEFGQKYMADNAPNDPAFAVWLMCVDRELQKIVPVRHRDLSDWAWRDAFDNGTAPADAAKQALHDDDVYGMVLAGNEDMD